MMINIHDFSKFILTQRVYKDRVVILCEGKIIGSYADLNLQQSGRRFTRSVKAAKQHDSHFYDNCKPEWWKVTGVKYPEFINAGSRSQAIETFFTLIDLHNQNPQTSYLNPAKLFALVDLDIQSQTLTTDQAYQPYNTFQEIEEIFRKLYNQGKFQGLDDYKNHVLVTGLIHKEAYFLLPELQSLLTEYEARYNDSELNLDTLYPEIARDSDHTKDLAEHLNHIAQRLDQYPSLDCADLDSLKRSWLTNYQNADDRSTWINALFLFKKAKPYWKKISSTDFNNPKTFQDNLCDLIAQFYRNRYRNKDDVVGELAVDHISCLFRTIYRIAYEIL